MPIQINGVGQHFYSAVPSYAGPGPHFHTIPGGHLQPQTMHSQHSPSPPNTYHKDERSQRQHTKLLRKLDQQKQREMSKFMSIKSNLFERMDERTKKKLKRNISDL